MKTARIILDSCMPFDLYQEKVGFLFVSDEDWSKARKVKGGKMVPVIMLKETEDNG